MAMPEWHTFTAAQWRAAVEIHGAEAGIRAALDRIARRDCMFNAFSIVLASTALEEAQRLDQLPVTQRGPLHGVPIAIKEEVDVAGSVTNFGSAGNLQPRAQDSLIVTRLRDAGAIILGKTTMPAFGAYPFTESKLTGITRNPVNPAYTPGGSSGGSAVAVADGMVPIAIGGDGGGSVRIPADHCGIVGLKPARGLVPTDPYPHLWQELGTAGPLARTVDDAELVYKVISGQQLGDHVGIGEDGPSNTRLKIGVNVTPVNPLVRPAADNVSAVRRAAAELRQLGHEVTEFRLKHPDPTPIFLVQFFAGIREEIAALEHPRWIEKRHRHTALLGAWARPSVVRWARTASHRFGQKLEQNFADFDVIITPTVANRPAQAGVLTGKGAIRAMVASIPSIAFTAVWNVSGHPALTIPRGKGRDGLPLSVQLIGSSASEARGAGLLC